MYHLRLNESFVECVPPFVPGALHQIFFSVFLCVCLCYFYCRRDDMWDIVQVPCTGEGSKPQLAGWAKLSTLRTFVLSDSGLFGLNTVAVQSQWHSYAAAWLKEHARNLKCVAMPVFCVFLCVFVKWVKGSPSPVLCYYYCSQTVQPLSPPGTTDTSPCTTNR